MAFSLFHFTKSWRNASDFPTFEPDEAKVRDDLQSLFDELKVGLNRLIDEIKASNIPFTPTAEVDSSDVQNAIENVQSQIASAILGELPDGSVTAQKIANSAVGTNKIEDGAITSDKIADGVIPEGSESAPLMDGTAAAGESDVFARADHVHPKDSSKADLSGGKVLPTQLSRSRVNVTSSRSLELTDDGKILYVSVAATIGIPTNSSVELPIGSEIILYRAGTGLVTIAPAYGVTVHSADNLYSLKQYDTAKLKKWSANVWSVEINHSFSIGDGDIITGMIADDAVTTGKINNGAVTALKIASNAVSTVYTATIPANGWTNHSTWAEQSVNVSGLLTTDQLVVDLNLQGVTLIATLQSYADFMGTVLKMSCNTDGKLYVVVNELPSIDIPIKILCIRK